MAGQLALDDRWTDRPGAASARTARGGAHNRFTKETPGKPVLCAACQGREARYGFRNEADDPQVERPRTLCFECFRVELARRQEAAQTVQVRLPLEETLDALTRRRRRAQIAARHALDLAQTS
jgi:hypothetical protein